MGSRVLSFTHAPCLIAVVIFNHQHTLAKQALPSPCVLGDSADSGEARLVTVRVEELMYNCRKLDQGDGRELGPTHPGFREANRWGCRHENLPEGKNQ